MTKLITTNFKRHSVEQFVESVTETANNIYYVFVGKHTEFANNVTPTPVDDERTILYRTYKDMIYGKKISNNDIAYVITKRVWVSNTIYETYSHDENNFIKNFYVATPGAGNSYDVFKCINNNGGLPSTYYPRLSETSAIDEIYETSDGYQWKYMYNITEENWNKFTSTNYMPVYTDTNVSGNAVPGTIDYVKVNSGGTLYNTYTQGSVQGVQNIGTDQYITIEATSSTVTDFYKNCAIRINNELRIVAEYIVTGSLRRVKVDTPFNVTPSVSDLYYISPLMTLSGDCCGDGTGFKARALVNSASSNSIYKVEIIERGQNYTFANLVAIGGVTTVSNTATFKAIISPKDGHGFNPAKELGSKGCAISVKFDASLSGGKLINENDFRTIGVLKDPLFANGELTISSLSGSLTANETVRGQTSNATGKVVSSNTTNLRLTNIRGYFQTSESIVGLTSNNSATVDSITQPTTYFDHTFKLVIDNVTGVFQEDEEVTQEEGAAQNANGSLYFANSTIMRLTDNRGTFNTSDDVVGRLETVIGSESGATAKVTGIIAKDLVDYEGDVLYIENVSAISRNSGQTETIKLILEF